MPIENGPIREPASAPRWSLAGENGVLVVPNDADNSFLFQVLTRETTADGSLPRMPYDSPLPTSEIALIKQWINAGADGLVVP